MHRRMLVAGLAAMTVVGTARAAAKTPFYTGVVTAGNATRFTRLLSDRLDKVVGLSVRIRPNTDAEFSAQRYLVTSDPKYLSIIKGDIEIFVDGLFKLGGGVYVVEGFFRVVSGGMHQGTLSYALKRTAPPPAAQVVKVAL